jgi:hypothetical protein
VFAIALNQGLLSPMLLLDSSSTLPTPFAVQNLALGRAKEYARVLKAFAPLAPTLASSKTRLFQRPFQHWKLFTPQFSFPFPNYVVDF